MEAAETKKHLVIVNAEETWMSDEELEKGIKTGRIAPHDRIESASLTNSIRKELRDIALYYEATGRPVPSELRQGDSGIQTGTNKVLWAIVHTIFWPILALNIGAFLSLFNLYFLFTIDPSSKFSKIYKRLYVASISIIEGIYLLQDYSFLRRLAIARGLPEWLLISFMVFLIATGVASIAYFVSQWAKHNKEDAANAEAITAKR
ncbi:MAG: hypothetical protein C4530_03580 [Desulfobacteraceae bacterium]|nr:MAG: hypothetical protein C4530_03580 [Desulfobacteraceae bacterium]